MLGTEYASSADFKSTVQCCVTSPPYWALRDYGHDDQLGAESTPEQYIENMVKVFAGVKRALRDDGTLWLNLGDTYAASGPSGGPSSVQDRNQGAKCAPVRGVPKGLKPKDLCGIPWRVALALQADGWYLRQDLIWNKPSHMPESVTDRCTRCHEYIFLLSKSQHYYFDDVAIREPTAKAWSAAKGFSDKGKRGNSGNEHDKQFSGSDGHSSDAVHGRNARSIWTITPQPLREAHFAVFPEALPTRCIKAGTSAEGCCASCGAPRVRKVERRRTDKFGKELSGTWHDADHSQHSTGKVQEDGAMTSVETVGWEASCKCTDSSIMPCLVLDPFSGSGTTGVAACGNGRSYVGIELNDEYIKLSEKRISRSMRPLSYRDMDDNFGPLFNGKES